MDKIDKIRNLGKELYDNLVYCTINGSTLYGLDIHNDNNLEDSDLDIFGVAVPELEYYFGLKNFYSRGTYTSKSEDGDFLVYEIKKYISLLISCNPSVISTLFASKESILVKSNFIDPLLRNREIFLTQKARNSFLGYAIDQLNKMSKDNDEISTGRMGEKRKLVFEKFGYDTKNAMHCIRLLSMGIEILSGKGVIVKRTEDRDFLLDIKRGKYSKKFIMDIAKEYRVIIDSTKSDLPLEVDIKKVNSILIEILSKIHQDRIKRINEN